MKRDFELLRNILLTVERDDLSPANRIGVFTFINEDEFDPDEVNEWPHEHSSRYMLEFNRVSQHITLLLDEGFIEAQAISIQGTLQPSYEIRRITARGYDYLDSVRDNNIWSKTKNKLGSLMESASLSTVTAVAQAIIKAQLGI